MISSGSEAGEGSPGAGQVLRLRMSPHNVAEVSRVEMLADCPIDHPFFVKDKGKCLPGHVSHLSPVCFIAGLDGGKICERCRWQDKKVDTVRI